MKGPVPTKSSVCISRISSAGVDVGDHIGDKASKMLKEFHEIFKKLNRIKCPTIASVKGVALGGGYEVAIFCDIVLTSEKFNQLRCKGYLIKISFQSFYF